MEHNTTCLNAEAQAGGAHVQASVLRENGHGMLNATAKACRS